MVAYGTAFRTDIEGLRAWAIVPVVVFHAFPQLLPGGFLGVDVFFVISGYLITKLLVQRMDAGSYTLSGFYAARVKRIFPALAVVLLVAVLLAWLLLPAPDLKAFGRSLMATVAFLSNQEFLRTSDYFGGDAELKPLLHTWSLAVEEQFYLLFPPLLWLLKRQSRIPPLSVVAVLGLLSLLFSQHLLPRDASAAFYLAASRAFELLIGAACAMSAGVIPTSGGGGQRLREGLGVAALLALGGSFAMLKPESPLPGLLALWPCLATAALIVTCADGRGVAYRLLSLAPLRWVGRISFSLYLWHWIVLVFLRYALLREPTAWETGAAVVLAVLAAAASLRWVEAPWRQTRLGTRAVLAIGGALIAVGLLVGAVLQAGWRVEPVRAQQLAAAVVDVNPRRSSCHMSGNRQLPYEQACLWGQPERKPIREFALWGDSHGAELAVALGEALAPRGGRVRQLTTSSCPPAPGLVVPSRRPCLGINEATLAALKADAAVTDVLLAAFFPAGRQDQPASFDAGYARAVDELRSAGKRVWLVTPVPNYDFPVPAALSERVRRGGSTDAHGQRLDDYLVAHADELRMLRQLAGRPGVQLLDVSAGLCESGRCAVADAKGAYYFDKHHLSLLGARRLAQMWAPRLLP
ncbi:MAG: acyltransferase [Roseateles depolymerans]|uniref:Acyltransferase n=1 Tax=Roseateles depolymerans TaxID=76731 RepID=A0A2W5DCH1_9BURK|nr:MAG: acyltransferase [Roseateles depolymerans]